MRPGTGQAGLVVADPIVRVCERACVFLCLCRSGRRRPRNGTCGINFHYLTSVAFGSCVRQLLHALARASQNVLPGGFVPFGRRRRWRWAFFSRSICARRRAEAAATATTTTLMALNRYTLFGDALARSGPVQWLGRRAHLITTVARARKSACFVRPKLARACKVLRISSRRKFPACVRLSVVDLFGSLCVFWCGIFARCFLRGASWKCVWKLVRSAGYGGLRLAWGWWLERGCAVARRVFVIRAGEFSAYFPTKMSYSVRGMLAC